MDLLSSYLTGAGRYYRLRDKCRRLARRCVICDKDRPPAFEMISEKFLHYLWAEQIPKGLRYQTETGQLVEVISPGCWNAQKGPDFTSARIRIGDVLCNGDIEMHLYASEWYAHKHHLDDNYNNIVLHIAFWADTKAKPIRCANQQVKPQVILSPLLMDRVEEIERLIELEPASLSGYRFGGVGRCYQAWRETGSGRLAKFLDMAGHARLSDKLKLLSERRNRVAGGYDEMLYRGVMQALGYKNNQRPFLELAGIISWKDIKQWAKRCPPAEHPLLIQAVLLRAGGFLPSVRPDGLSADAVGYISGVRKTLAQLPVPIPAPALQWDLNGVRPANYPQRRLAGISYLLSRYTASGKSMMDELIRIYKEETEPGLIADKLHRFFYVPPAGYWAGQSNFTGKPFARLVALIGKARSSEIIANAVIPLMLLYAQDRNDQKLADAVAGFYRNMPAGAANYATNFMRYRIFRDEARPYARIVNTALRQQGLIQIFNDFCRKGTDGCVNCGFLSYLSG
jgi:hypothetical protein